MQLLALLICADLLALLLNVWKGLDAWCSISFAKVIKKICLGNIWKKTLMFVPLFLC